MIIAEKAVGLHHLDFAHRAIWAQGQPEDFGR